MATVDVPDTRRPVLMFCHAARVTRWGLHRDDSRNDDPRGRVLRRPRVGADFESFSIRKRSVPPAATSLRKRPCRPFNSSVGSGARSVACQTARIESPSGKTSPLAAKTSRTERFRASRAARPRSHATPRRVLVLIVLPFDLNPGACRMTENCAVVHHLRTCGRLNVAPGRSCPRAEVKVIGALR